MIHKSPLCDFSKQISQTNYTKRTDKRKQSSWRCFASIVSPSQGDWTCSAIACHRVYRFAYQSLAAIQRTQPAVDRKTLRIVRSEAWTLAWKVNRFAILPLLPPHVTTAQSRTSRLTAKMRFQLKSHRLESFSMWTTCLHWSEVQSGAVCARFSRELDWNNTTTSWPASWRFGTPSRRLPTRPNHVVHLKQNYTGFVIWRALCFYMHDK